MWSNEHRSAAVYIPTTAIDLLEIYPIKDVIRPHGEPPGPPLVDDDEEPTEPEPDPDMPPDDEGAPDAAIVP